MENKRKASAAGRGGVADGGEPAAKRRKLPSDFPDLTKHESPESTTAYGLAFLEAIRKTADKHGRGVAGYFEKLLPREGNEDYYRRIQMPVSLRVIERRLYRQELANMTQLESWMKRMVNNAKEFYSRGSQTYEDAERVRKATSNYMVKTNPAYKKIPNYAATPAATPPDWDIDAEIAAEDIPSELAASDEAPRPSRPPQPQRPTDEEDAEGEDEEMPDAEADVEDADGAEGDADISRGSNTRIVLKRRGARSSGTEGTPDARSTSDNKSAAQFSEVPYQGLNFQQAQEKLVDELSTRQEEGDEWPYFEPFINLPPKSLKDYYQLIDEPMSLKKLWRAIKGMVGRAGATGVSEFKSWAALEEKASLLWNNAFYYNEEGSEIFELAKELKDAFYEQLNEAKACVEEPPQPKIILRAPSAQTPQAQSGRPKRITIHVGGGGREGSQGSPAPQASQPSPAQGPGEGAVNGNTSRPAAPVHPTTANLVEVAGPGTPSAVMKREDSNRASPTVAPPVNNGYSSSAFRPVIHPPASGLGQSTPQPGAPNGHITGQQQHQQHHQQHQQAAALYDSAFRCTGIGLPEAILANLCLRTPPDNGAEKQFLFNVAPHPKLLQQSFTVNLGANQWKLQIVPKVSPALEQQHRPYKLYVVVNGQTLARGLPTPRDTLQNGELLYDAQLHQGVNTIVLQMIAALPKGQRVANGSDAVLEKITILANVMKQY